MHNWNRTTDQQTNEHRSESIFNLTAYDEKLKDLLMREFECRTILSSIVSWRKMDEKEISNAYRKRKEKIWALHDVLVVKYLSKMNENGLRLKAGKSENNYIWRMRNMKRNVWFVYTATVRPL